MSITRTPVGRPVPTLTPGREVTNVCAKPGPAAIAVDAFGGNASRLERTVKARHPDATAALEAEIGAVRELARASQPRMEDSAVARSERAVALRPGVGAGELLSNPEQALAAKRKGAPYVFVLDALSPANVEAVVGASAVVVIGGRGNPARATAALGKPTVAVSPADAEKLVLGKIYTVDGTNGAIARGKAKLASLPPSTELSGKIAQIKARAPLVVTAEAHTAEAIGRAVTLGADRVRVDADVLLESGPALTSLRKYLLQTEAGPKRRLLEELVTSVRASAQELIRAGHGTDLVFAIGSRAPHSYFPNRPETLAELSKEIGLPARVVHDRVEALGAGNSKLGLRGARWGVKDPDLFAGIARGILEAYAAESEDGSKVGDLSLLIPSVSVGGELRQVRTRIEKERREVEEDFGVSVPVKYCAGIETAGGALGAAEISEHADAIEYSLAELTETLWGISHADAEFFLPAMLESGSLPADPFVHPDLEGIGKMVRVAQYLAGDTPNAFPASLRGPLAAQGNGLLLAEQAGVEDVTVSIDQVLDVRLEHLRVRHALNHAVGLVSPDTSVRNRPSKLFDMLTADVIREPAGGKAKIPDGTTALEYVEALAARVRTGAMSSADAVLAVPPDIVDMLGRPVLDPKAAATKLAGGIAASPGCGVGRVALSAEKAEEYQAAGEPYILVLNEVHAEEVPKVRRAEGLISVRGGKTSHAAMIASNSDVPCVMNEKVAINLTSRTARIGSATVKEGDYITLDGTKGHIYAGEVPLLNPAKTQAYSELMGWADQNRRLNIYANADTPEEAISAFQKGAGGVGLVRSEHMFFGDDRMNVFRAAILSEGADAQQHLAKLEEMQLSDFKALLDAADGKKVGIRLLDPPLYEFLPTEPKGIETLASLLEVPADEAVRRINKYQEVDSLMGMRGQRLAEVRPEICAMQVRAMGRAYVASVQEGKQPAPLHIMVPMIASGEEMRTAAEQIRSTIDEISKASGVQIPVKLGAMIETPRAALAAAEIAAHCSFFSYGTNDLTQLTLGYGRNVAAQFVPELVKSGALDGDPTGTLHRPTVGRLIAVAEFLGKDVNAHLEGGVCGGQGGDPKTIALVESLGLSYVSVPPAQVARARLAAAQAAVRAKAAGPDAVAQVRPERLSTTETLVKQIARTMKAVSRVPIPAEMGALRDQLGFLAGKLVVQLRDLRSSGSSAELVEMTPAFKTYFRARQLLDADLLACAIAVDIDTHREAAKRAGISAAVEPALTEAKAALDKFQKAATARVLEPAGSSKSERAASLEAIKALRGLDAAATLIGDRELPPGHVHRTRLRHVNDEWDNPYYTRSAPGANEPMGAYLKKVAADFLADNGVSVSTIGERNIPNDKPVVFAVTHRSGAIDRFIVSAALPFGDDDFMYIVREGSPLDQRAREAYGEDNRWILPARGLDEMTKKVQAGFAQGARFLITYPEGTGTLAGEPHYAARGTAAMAVQTGAVIVPVRICDSFNVRATEGGHVSVQCLSPIDPEKLRAGLGAGATDEQVTALVHTLMQFDLGSEYRGLL